MEKIDSLETVEIYKGEYHKDKYPSEGEIFYKINEIIETINKLIDDKKRTS